MTEMRVPIFPLRSVLFPGGALPLRIFEPRYLDMISNCMKDGNRFGVCLIREGEESGEAAEPCSTGTLVDITYFNMRDDGLLGVTIQGVQRFELLGCETLENQLIIGNIRPLQAEAAAELPEKYRFMAVMLRSIIDQLGYPYVRLPEAYDDATWVGSRLSELLPIPMEQKQVFLEMNDALARLEGLAALITDLKR